MKADELYDGLTDVRDDLILAAEQPVGAKKRPKRALWIGAIAAALALIVTAGVFLNPWNSPLTGKVQALGIAAYPETEQFTDLDSGDTVLAWFQSKEAQIKNCKTAAQPWEFVTATGAQYLTAANGQNKLISPLNVYLGLAMLAESANGETQSQILTLLGAPDLETLRSDAEALWLANYCDDGVTATVLANSLWLNRDLTVRKSTVKRLTETYFASVYRGEFGSAALDDRLRAWLGEQTRGILDAQAAAVQTDPETVLLLASTVYYGSPWKTDSEFDPKNTKPGAFHSPSGDVTVEYMHESLWGAEYFRVGNAGATRKPLADGGTVWFLLPDEGVTPEELAAAPETWAFLAAVPEEGDWYRMERTVPKLDLSVQTDLCDGLRALGVTTALDPTQADFSALLGARSGAYLGSADHAVRFLMDEEGCRAAAYLIMREYGGVSGEEPIDFTLDRPFLLVLTNPGGLPLFCGVVNRP